MNHPSKKLIRLLSLLLAAVLSSAALADGVQDPAAALPAVPAGYARYVVVLWEPGTPLPGGGYMGRMPEPNFTALGGFVRGTNANERLIDLRVAVRTGTQLSKPVQALVDAGVIRIVYIKVSQ